MKADQSNKYDITKTCVGSILIVQNLNKKMSIKIGMLFKKLFQLIVLTHNTDMAFLSIHEGKLQLEKKIKNGEKHTIFLVPENEI